MQRCHNVPIWTKLFYAVVSTVVQRRRDALSKLPQRRHDFA